MKRILLLTAVLFVAQFASAQNCKKVCHIGIIFDTLDETLASQMKIKSKQGLYVKTVLPYSTANNIKLMVKDVILEINGTPVANGQELVAQSKKLVAGEKVEIMVDRNGRKMKLKGTVVTNPVTNDDFVNVQEEALFTEGYVYVNSESEKAAFTA